MNTVKNVLFIIIAFFTGLFVWSILPIGLLIGACVITGIVILVIISDPPEEDKSITKS